MACAFHSPVVAGAGAGFGALVDRMAPRAPELPVWSNRTAARYPADPTAIGAELGAQIGSPVRFAAQIEAMYADGARVFVECGPGTVLSGLVAAILGDRPHRTVHFERAGGGLAGALTAVAELALAGVRPTADRAVPRPGRGRPDRHRTDHRDLDRGRPGGAHRGRGVPARRGQLRRGGSR